MQSIEHLDDNRLVQLYIKGTEKALEILVRRHKDRVYATIYMLVKDRDLTEDFFQDTFIKVIQSLKSGAYYEDNKFVAWVLRIARNLVMDYFRKEKKMPTIPNIVNDEGEEIDIFSILKIEDDSRPEEEKLFLKKTLRGLIEELPFEQKEVLIMRTYYDMSFKEISDATNSTLNTCLGRMRYALRQLRKLMEERNIVIEL